MRNDIVMIVAIVASSIVAVKYIERDGGSPLVATATKGTLDVAIAEKAPSNRWDNEIRISAARDNQFYVDVDVNRSRANFLIDTGASFVALRESDARAAGIYPAHNDFTYTVRTANGETKAAYLNIEEMEIQGIFVENVEAFILKDDQLSINLLGMSFLSRIMSVEARSGQMILRG